MKIFKKIFNKMPLRFKIYCRERKGCKNPIKLLLLNRKFKKVYLSFRNNEQKGLEIVNGVDSWYWSFIKFIRAQPSESEVAFEFFLNKIKIFNLSIGVSNNSKVILVCVVKNDLLKIEKLIEHHRKLGVKHFAILDNGSNDGTLEWLAVQKDVDLFSVEDKYTTNRREAWINRLIAYYGLNRWYLIVDSDELLAYYNMENKEINAFIDYCEKNSINRVRAVMIDMYASDAFYKSNKDDEFIENCRYFDLDTYEYIKRDSLDLITGGPRGRLFNQNPWLTKYPLCYFQEGDIQGKSHYLFPYIKNKNTNCITALLHYKFLPRDINKYRKIALEGNYFNGSIQYKNYIKHIEKNDGLSFINEQTKEYTDTDSLFSIPILEKVNL
ncbi:glycosyltransferase family 2 protein [Bacillus sp. REN16]|uniref:glycosyltransferase family 2 protein n=1 Tax=Bacillus sp. REN16 TaxID=2887296 RepID=UPI001E600337|nr:glycosyltransferase family 2 protein [Bacillus sp. REN16]MCC3356087.1 glycosyltransferase family 2 protein [Bacillus sp. REN16]